MGLRSRPARGGRQSVHYVVHHSAGLGGSEHAASDQAARVEQPHWLTAPEVVDLVTDDLGW